MQERQTTTKTVRGKGGDIVSSFFIIGKARPRRKSHPVWLKILAVVLCFTLLAPSAAYARHYTPSNELNEFFKSDLDQGLIFLGTTMISIGIPIVGYVLGIGVSVATIIICGIVNIGTQIAVACGADPTTAMIVGGVVGGVASGFASVPSGATTAATVGTVAVHTAAWTASAAVSAVVGEKNPFLGSLAGMAAGAFVSAAGSQIFNNAGLTTTTTNAEGETQVVTYQMNATGKVSLSPTAVQPSFNLGGALITGMQGVIGMGPMPIVAAGMRWGLSEALGDNAKQPWASPLISMASTVGGVIVSQALGDMAMREPVKDVPLDTEAYRFERGEDINVIVHNQTDTPIEADDEGYLAWRKSTVEAALDSTQAKESFAAQWIVGWEKNAINNVNPWTGQQVGADFGQILWQVMAREMVRAGVGIGFNYLEQSVQSGQFPLSTQLLVGTGELVAGVVSAAAVSALGVEPYTTKQEGVAHDNTSFGEILKDKFRDAIEDIIPLPERPQRFKTGDGKERAPDYARDVGASDLAYYMNYIQQVLAQNVNTTLTPAAIRQGMVLANSFSGAGAAALSGSAENVFVNMMAAEKQQIRRGVIEVPKIEEQIVDMWEDGTPITIFKVIHQPLYLEASVEQWKSLLQSVVVIEALIQAELPLEKIAALPERGTEKFSQALNRLLGETAKTDKGKEKVEAFNNYLIKLSCENQLPEPTMSKTTPTQAGSEVLWIQSRKPATQPATTQPLWQLIPNEPAEMEFIEAQLATIEPARTQPATNQPAMTQPAMTQPAIELPAPVAPATQPATQPAAIELVETQPAAIEPATQPATQQSDDEWMSR